MFRNSNKQPLPMLHAFTLVEIAIVLVVIGLLVGAILMGSSMLRQSEIQSVMSDYAKYSAATKQFKQQYGGLPGDLLDATNFWGDDNASCPDAAVTNGTPGTCNGNGNNKIEYAAAAAVTGEMFQYWKQLALSGYISGQYTGIAGSGGAGHGVIKVNVPASRISNSGWGVFFDENAPSIYNFFQLNSNIYQFGGQHGSGAPGNGVLTPEEMWGLDKKIDDGLPAAGKVLAYPASSRPNCASSDVIATATYVLTHKGKSCAFVYLNDF